MGGRFFLGISSLRLRFLTALMVTMLLGLSAVSNAEEVTYIGDECQLQKTPSWLTDDLSRAALFPTAGIVPLSSDNKVIVNYNPSAVGVTNPEFVYGGLSASDNTARNSVVLIKGHVDRNVIGGFSCDGTAAGNEVSIRGGTIGWNVVGGYCYDGKVTANTVTISGESRASNVCGGMSISKDAADNIVIIHGGSIAKDVFGGHSREKTAAGNSVTIDNGTVAKDVIGGYSGKGEAVGNAVTLNGGSVSEDICGGVSTNNNVVGNKIVISGGYVDGNIHGGLSFGGNATDNIVTISGGIVGSKVYGGYSDNGDATNNTVTISGRPEIEDTYIWGGYTYDAPGDVLSGNSLNLKSSAISAIGVGNFEYYNFYLPEDLPAGAVMLGVTETVDLKGTTVKVSLQGGTKLRKGDKITLIRSVAGIENSPKNKSCKVKQDGVLYEFSIYTDKNNLWAEVTKISNAAR